jgi:hypothetical protein
MHHIHPVNILFSLSVFLILSARPQPRILEPDAQSGNLVATSATHAPRSCNLSGKIEG